MQPGLDVTGVVEVIGRALVSGRFDAVDVGLGAALLRHVLISNAPRPGLLDVIAPRRPFPGCQSRCEPGHCARCRDQSAASGGRALPGRSRGSHSDTWEGHYQIRSRAVRSDFLVVGAGIAGASAGYFLASSGRVTLLEREAVAGYHSTGRSAALFSEYYGNPVVRALTAASRPFYTAPPPGFTAPLLSPRGVLALCPHGAEGRLAEVLAAGLTAPAPVRELGPGEAERYCPVVRPEWFSRAMLKPAAMDIDVDAVHQGFLRGIRERGGHVVRSARVQALYRRGGQWQAATTAGEFAAGSVINAAGAWADEIARLAGVPGIPLTPLRRTVCIVAAPDGADVSGWPMVADVTETFYVKPGSRRPRRWRSGTSSAPGRACAAGFPTTRRSLARPRRRPVLSGWPASAATASRPHRRSASLPRRSRLASRHGSMAISPPLIWRPYHQAAFLPSRRCRPRIRAKQDWFPGRIREPIAPMGSAAWRGA